MKKIIEIAKNLDIDIIQFPDGYEPPLGADPRVWMKMKLARTLSAPKYGKEGELIGNAYALKRKENYAIILENDHYYESLCYHEHSDRILWNNEEIKPHHYEDIAIDIERRYRLQISDNNLIAAVVRVANLKQIFPIRDYLNSLSWDGKKRLNNLVEKVFNCEVSKENRKLIQTMSQKMFIGWVARIFEPACKMDTMPILIGPKGTGKSECMKILASPKWFSRSHIEIGKKDALELIHQSGVWIWELAELKSLQGKTAETAKQFFSGQEDRFRSSYAKVPTKRKRRVCFFGTSNNYQILDDGAERRFWIFKNKGRIDDQYLIDNRDQIWAEAVERYKGGQTWYLTYDQEKHNCIYQKTFLIDDPWSNDVLKNLEDANGREKTTAYLMEELQINPAMRHIGNSKRINQICRDLGYRYIQNQKGRRVWIKESK
jgi:predicted P-loop ATPase